MPSLPSSEPMSIQPTASPSIELSSKPSITTLTIPTKSPEIFVGGVTSAPNTSDKSNSNKNTVALGAVFALTGVTILLLGYLLVGTLKKRQNGNKISSDRGPLDTTDTAFDNDEDPEIGNRQVESTHPFSNDVTDPSQASYFQEESKNTSAPLESYKNSTHTLESEIRKRQQCRQQR